VARQFVCVCWTYTNRASQAQVAACLNVRDVSVLIDTVRASCVHVECRVFKVVSLLVLLDIKETRIQSESARHVKRAGRERKRGGWRLKIEYLIVSNPADCMFAGVLRSVLRQRNRHVSRLNGPCRILEATVVFVFDPPEFLCFLYVCVCPSAGIVGMHSSACVWSVLCVCCAHTTARQHSNVQPSHVHTHTSMDNAYVY